jgi:hypothetical protein
MSVTFAPDEVTGFSARNRANYEGFVYARLSNPTVKQLEDKLAALEASESCQCYASGMAASHALLLGRLSQGDHLVISDTNYVGTAELVRDSLPRFGIAVTPVPTPALMRSTFRHEGDALRRYRDYAGDGVFRFSRPRSSESGGASASRRSTSHTTGRGPHDVRQGGGAAGRISRT